MGIINQIPDGFLDLIKAKTGGRNQTILSDSVAPIIDMTEFYKSRALTVKLLTLGVTFINTVSALTVPSNETWILVAASGEIFVNTVTDRIWWVVELGQLPNSLNPTDKVSILSNDPATAPITAAGKLVTATTFPNGGIVLPPGATLGARVVDSNDTGRSIDFRFAVYQFIS